MIRDPTAETTKTDTYNGSVTRQYHVLLCDDVIASMSRYQ